MANGRNGGFREIIEALQMPRWVLAALTLLFLAFTVFSTVLSRRRVFSDVTPFVHAGHWREPLGFMWVFVTGAVVGVLFREFIRGGLSEGVSYFKVPIKARDAHSGIFTILVLVASAGFWLASAWARRHMDRNLIAGDPGGLFAVFMGVVTFVGFAVTLHDLRELRRRITTFPDLIARLNQMLREDGEDDIRFLAYTPALGYIALKDTEFEEFLASMNGSTEAGKPRVDMICLNKPDLTDWHNSFIGRRTRRKSYDSDIRGVPSNQGHNEKLASRFVTEDMARAATLEGDLLVEHLLAQAKRPGGNRKKAPEVKRLPFEFLPGYYFFVSSTRAIVVAPLQLPFPKGAPKQAQQPLGLRTVQMLGLETNDHSIINDLADLYDSYKLLPSTYVAETSAVMSAADLRKWFGGGDPLDTNDWVGKKPEHFQDYGEALVELLRQFDVASTGKSLAKEGDPLLWADYAPHFKDLAKTRLEVTIRVALHQEPDFEHV